MGDDASTATGINLRSTTPGVKGRFAVADESAILPVVTEENSDKAVKQGDRTMTYKQPLIGSRTVRTPCRGDANVGRHRVSAVTNEVTGKVG